MRSVRVLWNVVTNYLRLLMAAGLGFMLTPFMVHHLGDRDYGLWVTVFSLTGYFGLFDQGIRPSLVRYVSRDQASGDRDGLARTISSAIVLYTGVGVVTMGVAALVAARAHTWLRVDHALLGIAPTLVLIVGATLALGFPLGVFGAVLSGLQRYDVANGIGMVVGVLRFVAFVGVLRAGGGLVVLAWTSLAVNLLGHMAAWVAARRVLPGVPIGPRWVRTEALRRIASYGGWALMGALATNIAFQTDSLVITAFLGAALVTPFALAAGLVDNSRQLVHAAAWVLSPTASEMDTLGEGDKLRRMFVAGSKYSVLVSWPVLIGLIVFGPNLLHTWVGGRYEWASRLLTILAVPTLVALPQATASSVLFGVSRHRGVVVLSLVAALVNLALSVVWARWPAPMRALFGNAIPPGLVGVAMGTAVPLFALSGLATAWFACRALGEPILRYAWEGLVQPGLVCLAFALPAVFAQRLWHPLGWGRLFGTCAGCWVLFALVAWGLGISGSDRSRWGAMLLGMLGRTRAAGEARG
ncbi:MAG TPA: oligosaccharide flippase family protein [Candidatus Acidoferrales bacterium]|nr:oligosaccharide flippase family protein [Candidatus Acidoferrales bacterium]